MNPMFPGESENHSAAEPVEPVGTPPEAAEPDETPVGSEPPESRRRRSNALEWVLLVGGAIVIALIIRAFLFQAFFIPSASMESTLLIHDRIIVNKLSYRLHDVHRGDIVVFDSPKLITEQSPEIDHLVKRVIGLPGETVEGRNNRVYIDGRRLDEPYLDDDVVINNFAPTVIPDGNVFVMGDNRNQSEDSRVFGPIDEDTIVGRAFVRIWPLTRFGFL